MLYPLPLTDLVVGKNTLGRRWKLAIASSLKKAMLEKSQELRAMQGAEPTRSLWFGLPMVVRVRGAMSDTVEAQDIDGQLYVSAHNLPEFMERATERGVENERLRIMEIIQARIDTHRSFINFCMDNDVQVTPSIFTAIIELRSLLRKIECQ